MADNSGTPMVHGMRHGNATRLLLGKKNMVKLNPDFSRLKRSTTSLFCTNIDSRDFNMTRFGPWLFSSQEELLAADLGTRQVGPPDLCRGPFIPS